MSRQDPGGADATVRRRLLAPRANAICEPVTGTLRRELSGQLPIITEHLCRFNTSIRPVAWALRMTSGRGLVLVDQATLVGWPGGIALINNNK